MAEEIVTLTWTHTTVEVFKEIQIDADVLRRLVAEHAPTTSVHDMLSDKLDWMPTAPQNDVLVAVVSYLTSSGNVPEAELDSESHEDLEHDAEELSEHDTCDECGELTADCSCCEECGADDCVCEDEDEDEDEESDDDD